MNENLIISTTQASPVLTSPMEFDANRTASILCSAANNDPRKERMHFVKAMTVLIYMSAAI